MTFPPWKPVDERYASFGTWRWRMRQKAQHRLAVFAMRALLIAAVPLLRAARWLADTAEWTHNLDHIVSEVEHEAEPESEQSKREADPTW